jgi:hypothetical protein
MHMCTDLAAFSWDVREIAVRSLAGVTGSFVFHKVQTNSESHSAAPGGGVLLPKLATDLRLFPR